MHDLSVVTIFWGIEAGRRLFVLEQDVLWDFAVGTRPEEEGFHAEQGRIFSEGPGEWRGGAKRRYC